MGVVYLPPFLLQLVVKKYCRNAVYWHPYLYILCVLGTDPQPVPTYRIPGNALYYLEFLETNRVMGIYFLIDFFKNPLCLS